MQDLILSPRQVQEIGSHVTVEPCSWDEGPEAWRSELLAQGCTATKCRSGHPNPGCADRNHQPTFCPSRRVNLPPQASRPGEAAWKRCHLSSAWEDHRALNPSSKRIGHLPQGDSSRIQGPGDIKRKLIKNSSLSSNCIIKSTELELTCKLAHMN